MSDFKSKMFAIRFIGKTVIIEETNCYNSDILIKDQLEHVNNGNPYYSAEFIDSHCGNITFTKNGWKIDKLRFPGNWFSERTHVNMIDRFGFELSIYGSESSYPKHREKMIRECFETFLKYSKYPFVKYKEFMDGIEIKEEMTIVEVQSLLGTKFKKYVELYQTVKDLLNSMEDNEYFLDVVDNSFEENLDKISKIKIVEQ